jgi:hypothetical protein
VHPVLAAGENEANFPLWLRVLFGEHVDRDPDVVLLLLEPVDLFSGQRLRDRAVVRRLRAGEKEVRVPTAHLPQGVALPQPLQRELPDRFKHPEPPSGLSEKALVHKRGQTVDVGGTDRLGRLEGAAADDQRERLEQLLLAGAHIS